jgi:hypothetical protein
MSDTLVQLRHGLLRLHKTLLDWERSQYERAHGRQSNADMLTAFLEHPQFAWLRPMSQLIVRIDEMLDGERPPSTADIDAVVTRARQLTMPDEFGDAYAKRYHTALQEVPDAIFTHREVVGLLGARP